MGSPETSPDALSGRAEPADEAVQGFDWATKGNMDEDLTYRDVDTPRTKERKRRMRLRVVEADPDKGPAAQPEPGVVSLSHCRDPIDGRGKGGGLCTGEAGG